MCEKRLCRGADVDGQNQDMVAFRMQHFMKLPCVIHLPYLTLRITLPYFTLHHTLPYLVSDNTLTYFTLPSVTLQPYLTSYLTLCLT